MVRTIREADNRTARRSIVGLNNDQQDNDSQAAQENAEPAKRPKLTAGMTHGRDALTTPKHPLHVRMIAFH